MAVDRRRLARHRWQRPDQRAGALRASAGSVRGGLGLVWDATHLDALCAGSGAAGSSQQQLVGTTDGGHTWKPAGSAHLGPDDIAGIADSEHGVLLVAASSGGSVVTRTTNDGASFATVLNDSLGGGTPWTDLGFTTAQQATVVLIGRRSIWSPDAGATWTAVTSYLTPSRSMTKTSVLPESRCPPPAGP